MLDLWVMLGSDVCYLVLSKKKLWKEDLNVLNNRVENRMGGETETC